MQIIPLEFGYHLDAAAGQAYWPSFGWFLSISVALIILSTSIHETGHYLAGRFFGWRGKIKFLPWSDAAFRNEKGYWAYLTLMMVDFPDVSNTKPHQVRLVAAAGPVLQTIFMGALFYIMNQIVNQHHVSWMEVPILVITVFAVWMTTAIHLPLGALLNLLPLNVKNDGYYIFKGKDE